MLLFSKGYRVVVQFNPHSVPILIAATALYVRPPPTRLDQSQDAELETDMHDLLRLVMAYCYGTQKWFLHKNDLREALIYNAYLWMQLSRIMRQTQSCVGPDSQNRLISHSWIIK